MNKLLNLFKHQQKFFSSGHGLYSQKYLNKNRMFKFATDNENSSETVSNFPDNKKLNKLNARMKDLNEQIKNADRKIFETFSGKKESSIGSPTLMKMSNDDLDDFRKKD